MSNILPIIRGKKLESYNSVPKTNQLKMWKKKKKTQTQSFSKILIHM